MRRWWVLALGPMLLLSRCERAPAAAAVVALQTADPSCRDDSADVYVDCGNGTVTDNRTGLVWLADAGCLAGSETDWRSAMEVAASLSDEPPGSADDCGLSDGSSPGEWRLPSTAELLAMAADAVALGCEPSITDDTGTGCWSELCNAGGACAFQNLMPDGYWTSTVSVVDPSSVFSVRLDQPWGAELLDGQPAFVWAVRGGQ